MHASVLVILYEGHETVEIHKSEGEARHGLLRFVDRHWPDRFGLPPPPLDDTTRIDTFFKDGGIYLIAKADLASLGQQIDNADQDRSRLNGVRLR